MTDRIQTHWEGCERTHGHSECACRVLDEKDARIARLEAIRVAAQDLIDYGEIGAPGFLYWEDKFDALRAALAEPPK